MIGTTISHYKILDELGRGGMGVVYKAQDLSLDRFVALKFLPPHLHASEQDKARFIQEAKAASALNHPNICTIHAIENVEGQMFIVMEFVDGQTLRERKSTATISLKQAIDIGIQIADGLAAAHEKGIVHRDIKPENIMIRKDGIAQVMDFGLAKLRVGAGVSKLTREGSTIGTIGYMSPEQVQGLEADHRSDIFSLGAVLYELFTEHLPFKGVHETALMYEIVNVDAVPMATVRPAIDPALDAIVLECLAKEPGERYQSVAEVSKELRRFKRESSKERVSRVTAVRDVYKNPSGEIQAALPQSTRSEPLEKKRTTPVLWISTTALFFLATAALAFLYLRQPSKEISSVRFTIPPPEKGAFLGQTPIVSPDGLKIAFVARDSVGRSLIWVRPLSSVIATPLQGTDDGFYPFWSPDSRFLGFFQSGRLKKIDASGGPPQTITDASQGRGGTWSAAGVIVFSPSFSTGLQQVSEAGGTPVDVTTLDSARLEDSHRWPGFLPDGRHFTYLRRSTNDEKTGLYLGSLDSKENTLLLPVKSNAVYASPGYLLFIRDRSLMAQPFDADKLQLNGQAFPIAENVGFEPTFSYGLFSASANGVLALDVGTGATGNRQLVWYDRTGKRLEKVGTAGIVFDFALSPDERRVVFRRIDQQTRNNDLWLLDLARQTESRFTFRQTVDDDPVWSPDGTRIIFDSNPEGVGNIHQKVATGAGSEEVLLKSTSGNFPLSWSPDGYNILYQSEDPKTKVDLWILPTVGDKKPYPYVRTEALEFSGNFSPDGRWIAYSSDESGRFEVYVQAFPLTQGKWQVSTGGGGMPVWGKDGKELFYLAPDKKLMAVDVKGTGTSFEQGIPQPLFDADVDNFASVNRYTVSRDGKRFLINTSVEGTSAKPIMVVMNWTAEITKK